MCRAPPRGGKALGEGVRGIFEASVAEIGDMPVGALQVGLKQQD